LVAIGSRSDESERAMSMTKVTTMKTFGKVIAFGFAAVMLTGAAFAQSPAPAAPAPAPSAPAPAAGAGKHAQSAHSLECSKEADAKGLHGKARKKFREECKKGQAGEAQ
jgi:psiF repeat